MEPCRKIFQSPKRVFSKLKKNKGKCGAVLSAEYVLEQKFGEDAANKIETWKSKKNSEDANARYNEMLYYGLGNDEEE